MIINTVTRKRHNHNTNALKKIQKIGGKVDTTKVKETKNLLVLISSSMVRSQELIHSVKTFDFKRTNSCFPKFDLSEMKFALLSVELSKMTFY
jgi:hypothetical protein